MATNAVNGDDVVVPQGGNNGNGAGGGDEESQDGGGNMDEGADIVGLITRLWKRKDSTKWSADLHCGSTTFERLKVFGALE
jgi:hypothetical protein